MADQNLPEVPQVKNEENAFDTTDVKAVRRTVTNVYSRGTYNPAQINEKLDMGKMRGGAGYKYDDVMGNGDEQPKLHT